MICYLKLNTTPLDVIQEICKMILPFNNKESSLKILLGSTCEMNTAALRDVLISPPNKSLLYETVSISPRISSQPVIGYEELCRIANERATGAYSHDTLGTAGLGIEFGLIKVRDAYLYTAVLILLLPNEERIATTMGVEIPKSIVTEARKKHESINATVHHLLGGNGADDPIQTLTQRKTSGRSILAETIKHFFANIDWTHYS